MSTWLNDSIACANVPTKMPIANWLGLSCKMVATMRGENWPIASWTTTRTTVSTRAVRLTIDPATVLRISSAASGLPVSERGIKAPSKARSTATLVSDSAIPAPMQTSGQNHMLVRSQ